MTKPSRMEITAVWDPDPLETVLRVKGSKDGYYYFAPEMDLYIQELKREWEAILDKRIAEGVWAAREALRSEINRVIDET